METFRALLAFSVMAGSIGELAVVRREHKRPPYVLAVGGLFMSFVWLMITAPSGDPTGGVFEGLAILVFAAVFVFLVERVGKWRRPKRRLPS
jgi:hypothetical protein